MSVIKSDPVSFNLPDWNVRRKGEAADPERRPAVDAPAFAATPGDLVGDLRSASDPFRAMAWSQRTLELHAQFRLKGAFELEDGTSVGFDVQVKIDLKVGQAVGAYAKTSDPQEAEDYFSPEKTAARIVDFAKGFFGAYSANHEGEESPNVLKGFFELARKAIEKGFGEAKEALGPAYGDAAEKTRSLVSELLDAAYAEMGGAPAAGDPAADKA